MYQSRVNVRPLFLLLAIFAMATFACSKSQTKSESGTKSTADPQVKGKVDGSKGKEAMIAPEDERLEGKSDVHAQALDKKAENAVLMGPYHVKTNLSPTTSLEIKGEEGADTYKMWTVQGDIASPVVEIEAYTPRENELAGGIMVADANFDGHNDVFIAEVIGASNTLFNLWLWDPENKRLNLYKKDGALAQFSNATVSLESKTISSYARSGGELSNEVFVWKAGELVQCSSEYFDLDGGPDGNEIKISLKYLDKQFEEHRCETVLTEQEAKQKLYDKDGELSMNSYMKNFVAECIAKEDGAVPLVRFHYE
ncbi:MAG: hypothetical protein M0Q29_11330 [Thiopseudomonas sp.]|nr:hypothetical protein [Thiopseudomonas sp.]